MLVYDLIKEKVPIINFVKKRDNNEFLIIENSDLEIFYLNNTAKDIINLCDGKNNIIAITNTLKDMYDVDEHILQNDIVDLIRDFQWKKILRLE